MTSRSSWSTASPESKTAVCAARCVSWSRPRRPTSMSPRCWPSSPPSAGPHFGPCSSGARPAGTCRRTPTSTCWSTWPTACCGTACSSVTLRWIRARPVTWPHIYSRRAQRTWPTRRERVDRAKEGKAEANRYSGGQSMLLTFGHGTASPEQMVSLLKDAGVSALIDVRTVTASRRHPHVDRAQLQRWLPEAGINHRGDKRLGGLRTAEPDAPDLAFGVDSLRGYAGHMRTVAFQAAVDQVLALASASGTAVMCAESLWWR